MTGSGSHRAFYLISTKGSLCGGKLARGEDEHSTHLVPRLSLYSSNS